MSVFHGTAEKRTIKLTQGFEAIIDEENYEHLINFSWCVHKIKQSKYAATNIEKRTIHMHRLIMGEKAGFLIDHIDGDGLNNRKINLRFATQNQNHWNMTKISKNKTSKFKGVSWNARDRRWVGFIKLNNKSKYLGQFNSEIEAALAYDKAAKYFFEQFAKTNF